MNRHIKNSPFLFQIHSKYYIIRRWYHVSTLVIEDEHLNPCLYIPLPFQPNCIAVSTHGDILLVFKNSSTNSLQSSLCRLLSSNTKDNRLNYKLDNIRMDSNLSEIVMISWRYPQGNELWAFTSDKKLIKLSISNNIITQQEFISLTHSIGHIYPSLDGRHIALTFRNETINTNILKILTPITKTDPPTPFFDVNYLFHTGNILNIEWSTLAFVNIIKCIILVSCDDGRHRIWIEDITYKNLNYTCRFIPLSTLNLSIENRATASHLIPSDIIYNFTQSFISQCSSTFFPLSLTKKIKLLNFASKYPLLYYTLQICDSKQKLLIVGVDLHKERSKVLETIDLEISKVSYLDSVGFPVVQGNGSLSMDWMILTPSSLYRFDLMNCSNLLKIKSFFPFHHIDLFVPHPLGHKALIVHAIPIYGIDDPIYNLCIVNLHETKIESSISLDMKCKITTWSRCNGLFIFFCTSDCIYILDGVNLDILYKMNHSLSILSASFVQESENLVVDISCSDRLCEYIFILDENIVTFKSFYEVKDIKYIPVTISCTQYDPIVRWMYINDKEVCIRTGTAFSTDDIEHELNVSIPCIEQFKDIDNIKCNDQFDLIVDKLYILHHDNSYVAVNFPNDYEDVILWKTRHATIFFKDFLIISDFMNIIIYEIDRELYKLTRMIYKPIKEIFSLKNDGIFHGKANLWIMVTGELCIYSDLHEEVYTSEYSIHDYVLNSMDYR